MNSSEVKRYDLANIEHTEPDISASSVSLYVLHSCLMCRLKNKSLPV
jgi:hypothetical protein